MHLCLLLKFFATNNIQKLPNLVKLDMGCLKAGITKANKV